MISDESACDERREVGFGEAIGDRKRDESDDPKLARSSEGSIKRADGPILFSSDLVLLCEAQT